jgi:hypothetical protein
MESTPAPKNIPTEEKSVEELTKMAYERYKEEITIRANVRTKASFLAGAVLTLVGAYAKNFLEIADKKLIPCWYEWLMGTAGGLAVLIVIACVLVYRGSEYEAPEVTRDDFVYNLGTTDVGSVKEIILERLSLAIEKNVSQNKAKESQFNGGLAVFLLLIILVFTLLFTSAYLTALPHK